MTASNEVRPPEDPNSSLYEPSRHSENPDRGSDGSETEDFRRSDRRRSRKRSFDDPPNSVLTMPIPGTKLAPEKFRGDFHKVQDFLQHYERLCVQHKVTDQKEICETILRYCSRRERQTIRALPPYHARSWPELRQAIMTLYDADLDTRRFRVRDLKTLMKRYQAKKIRNLAQWKKYCRAFLRVGGSLKNDDRISDKEYQIHFWKGIPRDLRRKLEDRILAKEPLRPLKEPFEMEELDNAANAILQRDRFDEAYDDSESDEYPSERSDSSSEDESSESSDSESEDEKRRRRHRRRKVKRTRVSRIEKENKQDEPTRKMRANRDEVAMLIKEMNSLSQDDPAYGLAYYKAMKLDDISAVVSKPILKAADPLPRPNLYNRAYQTAVAPIRSPATGPNAYPIRANAVAAIPSTVRPEFLCYGCGEPGHGIQSCPAINELISKGELARDASGRLTYGNGIPIRRVPGENFVQTYEREKPAVAHFVKIAELSEDSSEYGGESDSTDEDDEEWRGDIREAVFAVREQPGSTFSVERPEKQIAAKRKQVLDGVYPPRLKDLRAPRDARPNINTETGRPIRSTRETSRKEVDARTAPHVPKAPGPVPVEVETHRFNPERDEDIVEDRSGERAKKTVPTQKSGSREKHSLEKRQPRRSAVSSYVDKFRVLDHLLNTKVEISIGEVFAVSRELSAMLTDALRMKSAGTIEPTEAVPVGFTMQGLRTKTRGLLIKLEMACKGRPVTAIIDTGSEVNIVREDIAMDVIQYPVDMDATMKMNDANGGEGTLRGKMENVVLTMGGLVTRAHMYLGKETPFKLLLGRPWQRGNRVDITEEEDGTYLVFKDSVSRRPRYKILVTPDAKVDPEWDYDPSTWMASEIGTSLLVTSAEELNSRNDIPTIDLNQPDGNGLEQRTWNATLLDQGGRSIIEKGAKGEGGRKRGYVEHEYEDEGEGGEGIKEDAIDGQFPHPNIPKTFSHEQTLISPSQPLSNSLMEIEIGNARVRDERELPTLFTSPTTSRSPAEQLLAGMGDLTHFGRNNHSRDLILTSREGVVIGHLNDQNGNPRTDIMMLNMGLITPTSGHLAEGETTQDVHIERGAAIIHFFPNLGGSTTGEWQVPCLAARVSEPVVRDLIKSGTDHVTNSPRQDNTLVGSLLTAPPSPHLRTAAPTLTLPLVSSNDNSYDNDNEGAPPCPICLESHDGQCAVLISVPPPSNVSSAALSMQPDQHDNVSSPSPDRSDVSSALPALISISDSSESDDSLSSDDEQTWEEFRQEIIDELGQDPDDLEFRAAMDANKELWKKIQEAEQMSSEGEGEDWIEEASISARSVGTSTSTGREVSADKNGNIEAVKDWESRATSPASSMNESFASSRSTSPMPSIHFLRQLLANQKNEFDATQELRTLTSPNFRPRLPPVEVFHAQVDSRPSQNTFRRTPTPFPAYFKPTESSRMNVSPPHSPLKSSVLLTEESLPSPPNSSPSSSEGSPTNVGETTRRLSSILDPTKVKVRLESPALSPPQSTAPASSPLGSDELTRSQSPVWRMQPTHLRGDYYMRAKEELDDLADLRMEVERRNGEESSDEDGEIGLRADDGSLRVCFDRHVRWMAQVRELYPFIEINRPGPRTQHLVPVLQRPYQPYNDQGTFWNIQRVERTLLVDLRTLTIPSPHDAVPVPQTGIFSILAPRNHPHALIFPGIIWPHCFGPLSVGTNTAETIGDRLDQILESRAKVVTFIKQVRSTLAGIQPDDLDLPVLTLFTVRGRRLLPFRVNRGTFFRVIHPCFNPLITEEEASYLRGACYLLHHYSSDEMASSVDILLRTPQMDEFLCRELLAAGCLDKPGMEETTIKVLERYEGLARGNDPEE